MKVIRFYGIGCMLVLVASILIYVISNAAKDLPVLAKFHIKEPPHGVRDDVGIVNKPQIEKKLMSQIPMFRVSATRKIIYPIPLRKADQVVVNDEDDMMYESWVVMDKVVVIPKVIG